MVTSPDTERRTDEPSSLTHSQDTQRTSFLGVLRIDPCSVVFDSYSKVLIRAVYRDTHRGGTCVPGDIGQCLLNNTKHRGLSLRIKAHRLIGADKSTVDPELRLELPRLPLDSGNKPKVVKDRGPKLRRDPSNTTDRSVHL